MSVKLANRSRTETIKGQELAHFNMLSTRTVSKETWSACKGKGRCYPVSLFHTRRHGSELEQFKAMGRLIPTCKVQQCSQMQLGVCVREKRRSRCYPFSLFQILIPFLIKRHYRDV